MKALLFSAILFAGSGAFATQIIACGQGTSSAGPAVWAKVMLRGNVALLQSNQNGADAVDERMTVAIRSNENQMASILYTSSPKAPNNDSDFTFKLSFAKALLGRTSDNATLFIYAKSFMPGENGPSYSVKYTGCKSVAN